MPPVSRADLNECIEGWLDEGAFKRNAKTTLEGKRAALGMLTRFLDQHGYMECGTTELRRFFAAFGEDIKLRTLEYYYVYFKGCFSWGVKEGFFDVSPLDLIPKPVSQEPDIEPLTEAQVQILLLAAQKSEHPKRNEAILLFLLDTGVRASELCGLTWDDLNLDGTGGGTARVYGKGGKWRTVYFGRRVRAALRSYSRGYKIVLNDRVFQGERSHKGEPLTRSGLQQILTRLNSIAKIKDVRVSPHTFRHTFAVNFLRNGGKEFALQTLLGHTDLKMTQRYVKFSDSDMQEQHAVASPADKLKR